MKLIFIFALTGACLWAAVNGINNFLSVDDLKNCDGPSLTDAQCTSADAIVAISGGDTPSRVAEAVKLYKAGWAPKIVFSGAAQDDQAPSNAEVMAEQAMKAGVPGGVIIQEESAFDTVENALHTSAILGDVDRVILVTSPYHQKRAGLEFERFFPETKVVNHPTPYDRLWPDYWWTTWGGWWLAVTETVKTIVVANRL